MDNILQSFTQYSQTNLFFVPLSILASLIAGIIASLSPCSLGILPLIIGYVGGYSKVENKKLLVQMISFSVGLSFVLSIIGVICALTGRAFTSIASPVVLLLFASIILILGLNLVGLLQLNFPTIIKKMPSNKNGSKFIIPFLVGCTFALAASPCSSPLLVTIMALATVSKSILFSIILLFAFALGQCIIIILIAMFTSTVKHLNKFQKYSSLLMKLSGIILIITSTYIYYAIFSGIN
ncbi:cytochrome c biogenesis protein CcdA [bacterium]|nr:cytochrome c biogenesis protein CcdA [bacterium]